MIVFCLFCISIVFLSVSAYICKLVLFPAGMLFSPFLYFLCIYSRFLLHSYREAYIRYLIGKTVHFKLTATLIIYKTFTILLPTFCIFDIIIYLFSYCILVKK